MRTVVIAASYFAALAGAAAGADKFEPLVVVRTIKATKLQRATEAVNPWALSPDGRVLAWGEDKQVSFWDVATGKELPSWDGDKFRGKDNGDISIIQFLDPKTVAVSFAPRVRVHLRTYPEGKEVAQLDLGKNPALSAAAAPGLFAAGETGSSPFGVRLWAGPNWQQS